MRIGIDLGGTKIEGVVLDDRHRVVRRERIPTERDGGYDHVLERIASLVDALRSLAPDVTRVGIGTPGSVSTRTGLLKNSNTLCLNGQPVREDLGKRLGLDVAIENDANCFALAESRVGAARDHTVAFGVILGTGVGGGVVHRGEIWRGPNHVGGEWGHHRISTDGPECYCGRRGCVETFLAGPRLEARHAALGGDTISAAEISRRAATGDVLAVRVLDEWVEVLGRALANVVNVLDPDVIVLGGGLSNLDDLAARATEAVARWVFNDELRTRIVRHQLGDSAGVIGAALLA